MSWTDPATQAAATGDIITAGRFNILNSNLTDLDRRTSAYTAGIGTSESTASTTYTDLATAGPARAVVVGANNRAMVSLYASFQGDTVGALIIMSYQITGGGSYGPTDADSLTFQVANTLYSIRHGCTHLAEVGTGSCTYTMKYKVAGGGNGTWADRRIIVTPLGS